MAEDVQGERSEPTPGSRRGLIAAVAVGAAAVVALGVPMALAGQHRSHPPAGHDGQLPVAAGAAPTPFIEGQPPSLPPLDQQPDPSPVPKIVTGVKGMPNKTGCPVDAPRLLTALRASDLHERLAAPRDLAVIDCYATYALARTAPAAGVRGPVVFRYTEMTDSWRVIGGGTSAACDSIPEAVRPHLRHCR